ncbi:hypothetical protein SAMN05216576_105104 [Ectopseudomonas chengduensis]|uniref:Uncharacterized protein n=1 Tax=Ectopseudomonas chengduensis TaxID=489632 RepID=A0A1G6NFL8_9GAMM|nr:hypothetical protein [Pseudomonas chengduensis]MBP3061695.1 hypothetical protein [Pseudomonas chengduensis]NNB74792.1 hypothetical protein [Pseudomonas chengduensis]SDC66669.1 hypothetical protein SAMN05216576_105104 [Pseudomonas chengduensis]
MRDFIISIYEWMLILLLFVAAAAGFFAGYNINPYDGSMFKGLIGGIIGFVAAVPLVGHFITVLSIKESLEWQTRKIEGLQSSLNQIIAKQKQ